MLKLKPIIKKTGLFKYKHFSYIPFSRTLKPKFLTNTTLITSTKKARVLLFPDNRKLNFDLLNVFYTIIICGNIRLASERLFISQPAISVCINRLEKEVGTLLFEQLNSKKAIRLTSSGLILFNYVQRLFQILQETVDVSNSKFLNLSDQKFYTKFFSKNYQTPTLFNHSLVLNKNIFIPKNKFLTYNKFCFSLKNSLILKDKNLKYLQTKSKFLLIDKHYKNLNLSFLYSAKNVKTISLEVNKLTSLSFLIINKQNLIDNSNFIEVQNNKAFAICIDLKISNLICWGSEI